MITYEFYRFPDELEFDSVFALAGLNLESLPNGSALDVIGPIDGADHHVNAAWQDMDPPPAFAPYRITPATPRRVFAQRP